MEKEIEKLKSLKERNKELEANLKDITALYDDQIEEDENLFEECIDLLNEVSELECVIDCLENKINHSSSSSTSSESSC